MAGTALCSPLLPMLYWAGKASFSLVTFDFPCQGLGSLPPSLAAFCPWEHGTLVYVGFGMQKEALFYSLRKKQVLVPPLCTMPRQRVLLCCRMAVLNEIEGRQCSPSPLKGLQDKVGAYR